MHNFVDMTTGIGGNPTEAPFFSKFDLGNLQQELANSLKI